MSKGYASALALIEAGKQMAQSMKTRPSRSVKPEKKDDKPIDLLALMEQKRREYLAIKNFVEEQSKLAKPEEKKKSGWSVDHVAMLLLGIMPVNWAVLYLLLR